MKRTALGTVRAVPMMIASGRIIVESGSRARAIFRITTTDDDRIPPVTMVAQSAGDSRVA
jgi:hypothetical protein